MKTNAITTEYKGYKFRSRLEARWAVFFDEMKVKYLFESEGFNLAKGKYLPDFHLPDGIRFYHEETPRKNVWVEVKPSLELELYEKRKISQFVKQTNNDVLLLAGDPGLDTDILYLTIDKEDKLVAQKVKIVELQNGFLGLLDIDYFNNIADDGTKHAISQISETHSLLSAYKGALQHKFDRQDQYAIKTSTKRVCEDCGKDFIPQYDKFAICKSCYYERMYQPKEKPVEKEPKPNTLFSKKKYLIGIAIIVFISLMVTAYLIFRANRDQKNLAINTPPPICVCSSNQYNCGDFEDSTQAQACFDFCYENYGDVHYLDVDGDLVACEPKR